MGNQSSIHDNETKSDVVQKIVSESILDLGFDTTPAPRRVVKATLPKRSRHAPGMTTTDNKPEDQWVSLESDETKADEEALPRTEKGPSSSRGGQSPRSLSRAKRTVLAVLPQPIEDTPHVARELELERAELVHKQTVQSTAERQRLHREKEYEVRRLRHGQANPQQPSLAKNPLVKANPMSRFLSVFSVEPKHPEHKRSLDKTGKVVGDDETEMHEPQEKRRRNTSECDKDNPKEVPSSSFIMNIWNMNSTQQVFLVASAVAVTAVIVGAILSLRRST